MIRFIISICSSILVWGNDVVLMGEVEVLGGCCICCLVFRGVDDEVAVLESLVKITLQPIPRFK